MLVEKDAPGVKPLLIVVSHVVPIENADNAGQNLVAAQVRFWQTLYDVRCIILQGRSAREQLDDAIVPCHVLADDQQDALTPIRRRLEHRIGRTFPGLPMPEVAFHLKKDPRAKELIAAADVVALQWQRVAALAGVVQAINGEARIVSILHDVDSQAISRRGAAESGARARLKHAVQGAAARLSERYIVRRSHATIVLSEKDAALLPAGRVVVVPPPIVAPSHPVRRPEVGRVLFVAGARPENEEALAWFRDEVEPFLPQPLGDKLHVVGSWREDAATEFMQACYSFDGFVDDLSAEYSRSAVALVPLQLGAGVKFKTLEAVLHQVPLVTTEIGAEGILGLERSLDVSQTAQGFADRLARFLADPAVAERNAEDLRLRVLAERGHGAFEVAMLVVDEMLYGSNPEQPAS